MHTVILNNFFSFKMQRHLPRLLSPPQFGKNILWRIHPLILQYIEYNTFYSILSHFWENSSACLQLIKVIGKLLRNFPCFLLQSSWKALRCDQLQKTLPGDFTIQLLCPWQKLSQEKGKFILHCELISSNIPLCQGFKKNNWELGRPTLNARLYKVTSTPPFHFCNSVK